MRLGRLPGDHLLLGAPAADSYVCMYTYIYIYIYIYLFIFLTQRVFRQVLGVCSGGGQGILQRI